MKHADHYTIEAYGTGVAGTGYCRVRYDPHFRTYEDAPSNSIASGDVRSSYMFSVDIHVQTAGDGYLGLMYNAADLDNFDFIFLR